MNNGPVPEGWIVLHSDGDPQNNDLDNLSLGRRADNLVISEERCQKVAQRRIKRQREAVARSNRFRGIIRNGVGVAQTSWYAVDHRRRVLITDRHRSRREVIETTDGLRLDPVRGRTIEQSVNLRSYERMTRAEWDQARKVVK